MTAGEPNLQRVRFFRDPRRHEDDPFPDVMVWMVNYFNPSCNPNLPLWACPDEINPIKRAVAFPSIQEFRALDYLQQLNWLQLGRDAQDSRPALLDEMDRARRVGNRQKVYMVQNEIVLRAVEAKLILEEIRPRVEQANAHMFQMLGSAE